MRKPEFKDLLKVLAGQKPDRPTLFELFMNPVVYREFSKHEMPEENDKYFHLRLQIRGFKNAGYDYATVHASDFSFSINEIHKDKSISLNEYSMIRDRESFEGYNWPDPDESDYSALEILSDELADGMKFIVMGPGGVLENVIQLTGFDNLCFMINDDPGLVEDLFAAVGSRLVRYYEISSQYESVGALISNDDWGFNTQTMLSPKDMRKYVFPWHKRIAEVIHKSGKPAILHSCGNLEAVMEDIINDMKYDAKHSYEDKIIPVEEAYEKWGDRIAILGGIDVDFLCSRTPEEIEERAYAMLERTAGRGGYALGSGNSIPEYVPVEKYKAMIGAAFK